MKANSTQYVKLGRKGWTKQTGTLLRNVDLFQ